MLRIPWSTDIGLAHSQICVTLISLIAWSRSPTISAAKRLGGQRSQGISLPSWKLSHLFYNGALAFIFSRTHGHEQGLAVGARSTEHWPGEEFTSCRRYSPGNQFELSSQMNYLCKEQEQLSSVLENVGDVYNFTDYSLKMLDTRTEKILRLITNQKTVQSPIHSVIRLFFPLSCVINNWITGI